MYELLRSKQMGISRSCFGCFPRLNKCEFIHIYLIIALKYNLFEPNSLGLVMVVAPLGYRE